MTKDADFKAQVRARMERTGDNYTAARAAMLAEAPAEPPRTPESRSEEWQAAEREQRLAVGRLFRKGRIPVLPVKRKNIAVVMLELLAQFEPGRDYPEGEVNELLGAHHDDYAYLRRELVDYGYLTRRDGIYRVTSGLPERSAFQAGETPDWERLWLPEFIAGRA